MDTTNDHKEEDIKKIISNFIKNNFVFDDQNINLDEDISLYENRIVDSTGVLEIVDFLEETFEIKIEDEELVPNNLDSINKMSKFIWRKIDNASKWIPKKKYQ